MEEPFGLEDHSDASPIFSVDPVCGMQVDEAKAPAKSDTRARSTISAQPSASAILNSIPCITLPTERAKRWQSNENWAVQEEGVRMPGVLRSRRAIDIVTLDIVICERTQ
jgi:hypothetical protein